jgi:hypothetical protein
MSQTQNGLDCPLGIKNQIKAFFSYLVQRLFFFNTKPSHNQVHIKWSTKEYTIYITTSSHIFYSFLLCTPSPKLDGC